jgi:hypothetical protein
MMNQDFSTQNGRREIYSLREIVVLALGTIYENIDQQPDYSERLTGKK